MGWALLGDPHGPMPDLVLPGCPYVTWSLTFPLWGLSGPLSSPVNNEEVGKCLQRTLPFRHLAQPSPWVTLHEPLMGFMASVPPMQQDGPRGQRPEWSLDARGAPAKREVLLAPRDGAQKEAWEGQAWLKAGWASLRPRAWGQGSHSRHGSGHRGWWWQWRALGGEGVGSGPVCGQPGGVSSGSVQGWKQPTASHPTWQPRVGSSELQRGW